MSSDLVVGRAAFLPVVIVAAQQSISIICIFSLECHLLSKATVVASSALHAVPAVGRSAGQLGGAASDCRVLDKPLLRGVAEQQYCKIK